MRFLVFILLLALIVSSSAGTKAPIGSLEFRIGSIQVKNTGAKKWEKIDEGDKISTGDTLKIGEESKCEIKLNDGSIFKIDQNSLCVFSNYEVKKGEVICKFNQIRGKSWTSVNKKDGKKKDFQVKSPVAVAAVIGTVFKFSFDGDATEISVAEGQVNVDLDKDKKTELNIPEPDKKNNNKAPGESYAPKEIPGPYEVTLSQWISIVKGEVICVRNDGKYCKTKTSPDALEAEFKAFNK